MEITFIMLTEEKIKFLLTYMFVLVHFSTSRNLIKHFGDNIRRNCLNRWSTTTAKKTMVFQMQDFI